MNTKTYSHVIWDWNGTLFDDIDWCIQVINHMLLKRGLNTLNNRSDYHKVFCFPIIQYYKNVGFDFTKEPFEALAEEYINLYHANRSGNCELHTNAEAVLHTLHLKNKTQIILSASEIQNLESQIAAFDISKYFDQILGISDIYAKSKVDIGKEYIKHHDIEHTVMIGDTVHDSEVAHALGIDCILISNGHQSKETLLSCNTLVLDDISEIVEHL